MMNCMYCGGQPNVIDWHGIGDVFCPRCKDEFGRHKNSFHFSGKFHTKKKEAIKWWNYYNSKGIRENEERGETYVDFDFD